MSIIATQCKTRHALYDTWMSMLIETALLCLKQARTIAVPTPCRWNWLVMTRSSLGVVLQWARERCCYCEKCPGSLIHLSICAWLSASLYHDLTTSWKNCCVVGNMVIGFLLPSLKQKLTIWVMFKLPFSHPMKEILLPTGVFVLPRTMRLMGLLSLVRFIVTWGYFKPKHIQYTDAMM